MRPHPLFLFSSACVVSGAALLLAREHPDLPVVPNLDLARYSGKWYEIARLPNSFQRKCAGHVTATYTPRAHGAIQVLNTCREANGAVSSIKGSARTVAAGSPAKLKVTFFWPFTGDYWIIALDSAYRWAMVGTPNRKYLWILSRTPALPPSTLDSLLSRAKALGFDIAKVQPTPQS